MWARAVIAVLFFYSVYIVVSPISDANKLIAKGVKYKTESVDGVVTKNAKKSKVTQKKDLIFVDRVLLVDTSIKDGKQIFSLFIWEVARCDNTDRQLPTFAKVIHDGFWHRTFVDDPKFNPHFADMYGRTSEIHATFFESATRHPRAGPSFSRTCNEGQCCRLRANPGHPPTMPTIDCVKATFARPMILLISPSSGCIGENSLCRLACGARTFLYSGSCELSPDSCDKTSRQPDYTGKAERGNLANASRSGSPRRPAVLRSLKLACRVAEVIGRPLRPRERRPEATRWRPVVE